MTDLSTYDILNDIRNGKTPVKRQNPQPGKVRIIIFSLTEINHICQ